MCAEEDKAEEEVRSRWTFVSKLRYSGQQVDKNDCSEEDDKEKTGRWTVSFVVDSARNGGLEENTTPSVGLIGWSLIWDRACVREM
jgi:hypothetical protein